MAPQVSRGDLPTSSPCLSRGPRRGHLSGRPAFPVRLPVTISESELKGRSRRRACSSSVFAKGNDVAHRVHSGSPAAKVRGVRLGNPNGARALPGKQVGNADVMAKINANARLRAKDFAGIIATKRASELTVQRHRQRPQRAGHSSAAWWHVGRYSRLTGTRGAYVQK